MSRNELVDSYVRGHISRRQFIKGMTALGASLTAATAFADQIRAAPASGGTGRTVSRFAGDIYDDVYDGETGGVTTLPSTGAGALSTGGGVFGPLAMAASAAAAGIALRLRRMKGKPSDGGAE